MTFGDTSVVASIVLTHLRNPELGMASGANACTGDNGCDAGDSATLCKTNVDSNQNKQVIYLGRQLSFRDTSSVGKPTCAAKSPKFSFEEFMLEGTTMDAAEGLAGVLCFSGCCSCG